MDIDRIISGLRRDPLKTLATRRKNAEGLLLRNPEHADALRLLSAVHDELATRKMASRIRVGPLWWEPHDPDVPTFHAYETAQSVTPVAEIFKSDTHTATRKVVYSVRIGTYQLPERFAEVAVARQAGSDAWDRGARLPQAAP